MTDDLEPTRLWLELVLGGDQERLNAVAQLRKLAVEGRDAEASLCDALEDTDGMVRFMAAEALARARARPEEAVPVLQAVIEVAAEHYSDNPKLADDYLKVAIGALAWYGEQAGVALGELDIASRCASEQARAYVAQTLGRMGVPTARVFDVLDRLAADESSLVRECAVEATDYLRERGVS